MMKKFFAVLAIGLFALSAKADAQDYNQLTIGPNTPWISVANMADSIAFYENAFGLKIANIMTDENGLQFHGEIAKDGALLAMIGPMAEGSDYGPPPALSGIKPSFNFYVYVSDVDALAAHAVHQGATQIYAPRDEFWGERTTMLADINGYYWIFAKPLAAEE